MSDLSLRELQRRMQARIVGANATQAPLPLNPQRGTPGEARMAVYAEGYLVRIREALAEVYEAVHHILGEETFAALAEEYAARHPSHDYNLSLSGRHLPAFLPGWRLTERLPFLPDLASLEWRVCEAFHAFDAPPTDVRVLSRIPERDWERLQLTVQPSAAIVDSAWPVLDLWSARQRPRDEVNIELAGRAQCVLVSRQQDRVRCELIDQPQRRLLEALRAGRTLGDACAEMAATLPTEPGHPRSGSATGVPQRESARPTEPGHPRSGSATGVPQRESARPTEPGAAPPLAQWFAAWGRAGLITRINLP